MKRKYSLARVLLFASLVVSLLLPSGVSAAPAAGPIKIGAVLSISGWAGMIGTPMKDAFIAIIDDVNRRGGINGRPIEFYVEDDKSNPTNAVIAATKLVRDMKVALLMGPTISDSGMAMIPIAEQEQIPFAVTGPIISPLKKWVFHVTPNDGLTLSYMLEYAANTLKAKRIAVIHDTAHFGTLGWKIVQSEIKQFPGVSIVAEEKFEVTDTNMIPQLTKVKAANPDLILLQATGGPAAVIAKNCQQLGIKTAVVAPPAVTVPEFLKLAGPIAEENKWIFLTPMLTVGEQIPPGDTWRKSLYEPFKKLMQEKYGPTKQVNIFHSVAHDDIQVVMEALKMANADDRAAIRDALEKIRYVGLNGTYACSPTDHRGITKWFGAVAVLKNGAFVPYEVKN